MRGALRLGSTNEIALPTPDNRPSEFPVGWRKPFGNGSSIVVIGMSVFCTRFVVCEKPTEFTGPELVGAQKRPYPPRTTVVFVALNTAPARGDSFTFSGFPRCCC